MAMLTYPSHRFLVELDELWNSTTTASPRASTRRYTRCDRVKPSPVSSGVTYSSNSTLSALSRAVATRPPSFTRAGGRGCAPRPPPSLPPVPQWTYRTQCRPRQRPGTAGSATAQRRSMQDGPMDLGLAGRVYLLTGASRGLGFAAAQALVADGAHVIISSRDGSRVGEAVTALHAEAQTARSTGTAHGIVADNADEGTAHRLVSAALHGHGRLDGALISVGGPARGTASAIADTQWRDAFESLFLGAVRLARTVAGHLSASGGGAIAF